MKTLSKVKGHLSTINKHKIKVGELCFRCGLYKQGLLHDMSKYSPIELRTGFKYYQGYRSPIDAQKEEEGYSMSWLHHNGVAPVKMPERYVYEMFCDRVAASMIYQKEKYTDHSALDYYMQGRDHIMIHPETDRLILFLLCYLSENGLEKTCRCIRRRVRKGT